MDLIKKHFEKIVLAVTLLVLMGVALVLWWKVDTLSTQVKAGLIGPAERTPTTFTATGTYSNALDGLKTPAIFGASPINPFHTENETYFPPAPIGTTPKPTPKEPFTVKDITHKPFPMVFKSYTGQGDNFAINLGPRTFIVRNVGDKIWDPIDRRDTGFVIIKFEKKESTNEVQGIPGEHLSDTSRLTIQCSNEPPILLVLNRVTWERAPEAVITCQANNQNLLVRKGQHASCGGKVYNIVDITLEQVIIVDDVTKKTFTVSKK